MRGIGVIEFGGPEALKVVDLPEVHAGSGEVRISGSIYPSRPAVFPTAEACKDASTWV